MANGPLPRDDVFERLPKTDADADLLKPAIAGLLRTIPEAWTEFDLDALTQVQDNALFLLTAAGMVERRGWIRSTIANHPTCFEVRFQATGDGGFAKAMEQATAAEYATWSDAWRTWKAGETGHISPFHTEVMKPQEWRLTDQGVIARGELDGTNRVTGPNSVFDFVFKRGSYGPGYWCRLAVTNPSRVNKAIIEDQTRSTGQDWQNLPRPPLSGSGLLVEFRKIERPAGSQAVDLTKWGEGAKAFAAAFGNVLGLMFQTMSNGQAAGSTLPEPLPAGNTGHDEAGLAPSRPNVRNQVFISYSHKDKRWLEDLQTHLKPHLRDDSITAWSDQQITTGSKWFSEIQAALARTSVAVLLVTPNFLASDFIHEYELTPILKEAERGGVRIVWIPVEACAFTKTPLKDYQAVIAPEKPLAGMKKPNRDKAWVRICEEIEQAVKQE